MLITNDTSKSVREMIQRVFNIGNGCLMSLPCEALKCITMRKCKTCVVTRCESEYRALVGKRVFKVQPDDYITTTLKTSDQLEFK